MYTLLVTWSNDRPPPFHIAVVRSTTLWGTDRLPPCLPACAEREREGEREREQREQRESRESREQRGREQRRRGREGRAFFSLPQKGKKSPAKPLSLWKLFGVGGRRRGGRQAKTKKQNKKQNKTKKLKNKILIINIKY